MHNETNSTTDTNDTTDTTDISLEQLTLSKDEISSKDETSSTSNTSEDSFEEEVIAMMNAVVKTQFSDSEFDTFRTEILDKQIGTIKDVVKTTTQYMKENNSDVTGLYDKVIKSNPIFKGIDSGYGAKFGLVMENVKQMAEGKVGFNDYITILANTMSIDKGVLIDNTKKMVKNLEPFYQQRGINGDFVEMLSKLITTNANVNSFDPVANPVDSGATSGDSGEKLVESVGTPIESGANSVDSGANLVDSQQEK